MTFETTIELMQGNSVRRSMLIERFVSCIRNGGNYVMWMNKIAINHHAALEVMYGSN